MTILGRGDLVPRRRRRRPGRVVAGVAVLVVLAGAGYVGYRHFHGHHHPATTATVASRPTSCPSSAPAVTTARRVRVVIRNGSLRTGLAATVAGGLRRHGFRIPSIGNALAVDRAPATISYAANDRLAAATLARYVPGAVLQSTSRPGLELDLGTTFHGLASSAAMHQADLDRRAARRAAARGCSTAS